MRRTALVIVTVLVMGWRDAQADTPGEGILVVRDVLHDVPLDSVHLEGHLGQAIETAIAGRITSPEAASSIWPEIIGPFQRRDETNTWRNEFSGKWSMSALAAAQYTHNPSLRAFLDQGFGELLATQNPSGYLGTYADRSCTGRWDLWGQRYTLLGLIAYYDATGDERALAAARRHTDFMMTRIGPKGANILHCGIMYGIPSCDVLEPVVLLYARTGEKRYLEFAEYIVSELARHPEIDPVRRALRGVPVATPPRNLDYARGELSPHAYATMALYDGLMELYRVTGRTQLRQSAVKVCKQILDREVFITGGVGAHEWYEGRRRQTGNTTNVMETCAGYAWMHLCENMLRLTGEPHYADQIELTAYNHILGAMKPDGTWWTMRNGLTTLRGSAKPQCGMKTMQCCVANGPRALLMLPTLAVMNSQAGPVVNLYCQGTARVRLSSGDSVVLQQETAYPETAKVTLRIMPAKPQRFALRLRIPGWSERNSLTVNGQPRPAPKPGTYARIDRAWQAGDRVELTLDLRGRVVPAPEGSGHVAVQRGPILLARDQRLDAMPLDAAVTLDHTGKPTLALEAVSPPQGIWMAFRVPVDRAASGSDLRMCDYSSAGNTWDAQTSNFRVWLPNQ